jgi:uncharacterized BrkB/YihY/UPF0761 family membrane protein
VTERESERERERKKERKKERGRKKEKGGDLKIALFFMSFTKFSNRLLIFVALSLSCSLLLLVFPLFLVIVCSFVFLYTDASLERETISSLIVNDLHPQMASTYLFSGTSRFI